MLEQLLASDLAPALGSLEIVGKEIPFLLEADGERWTGTIDLLYRASDGRLVVADYKTDRDPPDEPPEAYRRQLAIYARAVARLFQGEPAPARELLYVRHGVRQRIGP